MIVTALVHYALCSVTGTGHITNEFVVAIILQNYRETVFCFKIEPTDSLVIEILLKIDF